MDGKNYQFSLSTCINMAVSIGFSVAAVVVVVLVNYNMRAHALHEAKAKAQIILDRTLATNDYFTYQLKPKVFALSEATHPHGYFDPTWMSSTYANREIDKYFKNRNNAGYYIKMAAINARSPENEANDYERAFINELSSKPELITKSGIQEYDGKPYLVVLERDLPMSEVCQRCHSIPERAPKGLVDIYGAERGFNRQINGMASVVSIRIPLSAAFARSHQASLLLSGGLLILLIGLFLTQFLIYKRFLLQPLKNIYRKARQISQNDRYLGDEISLPRGRELNELALAFNKMSITLRDDRDHLTKLVKERTRHLEELLVFSKTLITTVNLQSLYKKVSRLSKELLKLDFSTLMILSEDHSRLIIQDTIGFPQSSLGTFTLVEGQGLSTFVVKEKKPATVLDFNMESRFEVPLLVSEKKIISALCVPMMLGDEVFGVLIGHTHAKKHFTDEELSLYQSIANQAAVAIKNVMHLQALKESETDLLKSKEEWERTFNSIPDIVTLQDTDMRIVKINQVGCDTVGRSCNKIKGQHCYELFHAANEPCHNCPLLDTKKTFQPYIREMYHEKLGKTFLVSAAPVMDENGNLEYIAHIAKDITKQKRLQLQADQRLQQVIQADKLASLGEVVAGVAHEINNPNSFISYNVPLLAEMWQFLQPFIDRQTASAGQIPHGLTIDDCCQDMEESIEAIQEGSERINKVVNNLKDFARLDDESHPVEINLNEVIEKAYFIVGAQVRKSVDNIEFSLDQDLPMIQGRFQKFEQVMANLLINASHAIPENVTGKISIATRFIKRLKSAVVTIDDNGIGMDRQTMTRIFEPFFTTRRELGGTGLGLSVSHGLIQEHFGIIGVLSRPGIGTRFTLILPKDPANAPPALQSTILLIDEAEHLSALQAEFRGSSERELKTLSRQEEVVPFLTDHPEVDIIFCTIKSTHINGWDLLEKIRMQFPLLSVVFTAVRL